MNQGLIPPKKIRVAVAVSGGGRTLKNLLAHQNSSFEVVGVVASHPQCGAVQFAQDQGLPLFIGTFSAAGWESVSQQLQAHLTAWRVDWIVLGGFLKPFPILGPWRDRIINIHPALLPKFGGKGMYGHHVHEAVLKSGATMSGATVHFVNERYDEGNIIAQVEVAIQGLHDAEAIAARVFAAECDLYPRVIEALAAGKLPLSEQRVWSYQYFQK